MLLDTLLEGTIIDDPSDVVEPMTESDMSDIIRMAIQDAVFEQLSEGVDNPDAIVSIMETMGVDPSELTSVQEVSIVRLDKQAKKQKAYKLAILQCAKEDENKDYAKLVTLWKMEKWLMRRLEKRYSQRAKARMKQSAKQVKTSKPGIMTRAKNMLTRSQRETKKAMSGAGKPNKSVIIQGNNAIKSLSSKIS